MIGFEKFVDGGANELSRASTPGMGSPAASDWRQRGVVSGGDAMAIAAALCDQAILIFVSTSGHSVDIRNENWTPEMRTDIICRFSNLVSFPEALNCGDAGCLTSCHLRFVSYSCHFLTCPVFDQVGIADAARPKRRGRIASAITMIPWRRPSSAARVRPGSQPRQP
jgi:hypothetical protein